MPDDFKLLRFVCGRCQSALNLIAVDRTQLQDINIGFLCYDCLIESGIVDPKDAAFYYVSGVVSAK